MKSPRRTHPLARIASSALAALALAVALPAAASAAGTVFVQTDGLSGNHVVAYDRAADGTLSPAGTYGTEGLGGQLTGSVVDHLASQGGLVLDRHDGLLLAVNAGSGTLSVFGVFGDRLALRQVVSSGGSFPSSVTVHGGLVYVLNAGGGGSLQGFAVRGGRLAAIPGANTPLGLPQNEPQFVNTPGQVAFTPGGSQLLVTTKATTSSIEVFPVGPSGTLGAATVNAEPGKVPFSLVFDRHGNAVVSEAAGFLATLQIGEAGVASQLDSVAVEQKAPCWIVAAGGYFYVSNAGSATLTGFAQASRGNVLVKLGNTPTDAGTVDAATVGRDVYVQAGAEGKLDEFSVGAGGVLTPIGSLTVPGAVGGEGIAAS